MYVLNEKYETKKSISLKIVELLTKGHLISIIRNKMPLTLVSPGLLGYNPANYQRHYHWA